MARGPAWPLRVRRHVTERVLIPSFFLFGEPPQAVGPKFLHLEDLDDRSRPNNWNIRPHAHADLSHIFHITAGSGVMRAEAEIVPFAAPCLVLVPAGVVHGFNFETGAVGSVLTIARDYLADLTLREPQFAALFETPRQTPLGEASPVGPALTSLARELVWTAAGHAAAVESHLLAVLVEALRRLMQAEAHCPLVLGPHAGLVARFREAIEGLYRTGAGLEDYAGLLGVTPTQLRAACLKAAGAPPLNLVHARTVLEAKRALLYSSMTVAEVAYYLGFEDPAYFSRFFAKAVGQSPRAYRQALTP